MEVQEYTNQITADTWEWDSRENPEICGENI